MPTSNRQHHLLYRIVVAAILILTFGISHAQYDPPSLVARLNYLDGPVSFEPEGSDDWAYAVLNRPMTAGDQIWVDKGGRSELHIGSMAIRLGSQTSMAISTLDLDDAMVQLRLSQGTMSLNVRTLPAGQMVEVDTPNLAFTVQSPGKYRINVDPNGQTTTVIVRSGYGLAQGDQDANVPIDVQQSIVFSGTGLQQVSADTAPSYDGFDRWLAQRDLREDQSISARYVSRDMIGYEELDNYGTWSNDPNYGYVWIPSNPGVGWAPYHTGHWVWMAPWGWTWVDDQPWGFAPAHYGRWAYFQSRWGWIPGPVVVRPVYAPALVAFVGDGNEDFNWGITLDGGTRSVAWFPLGPGEIYHPAYMVSPTYVNNLNKTVFINKTVNVTNVTNNIVINNITKAVYVNQNAPNAVTAVPAISFVRGQSTATASQPVNLQQLAHARVVSSTPAIAPVKESVIGAAKPAPLGAPPAAVVNRQLVATRAAARPAALDDALAAKFNTPKGVVPGAGRPMVHVAGANSTAVHFAAPMRIVGSAAPVVGYTNTSNPTGATLQQPVRSIENLKDPSSMPAMREMQPASHVSHPPTAISSSRAPLASPAISNSEDHLAPQNQERPQPLHPPVKSQAQIQHPASSMREATLAKPIPQPKARPEVSPQGQRSISPEELAPHAPSHQDHSAASQPKKKPKSEEKEKGSEADKKSTGVVE